MTIVIGRALLLGTSACALAMAAAAPAAAQTAPVEEAGAEPAAEDIVITGSRIVRPDYNSPSPIVSVKGDALTQTGGSTLDSVLRDLPQFTPSRGATSGGGSQGGSGQGQITANIRGLGPQRTLILLDGRRLGPSNPDGTADLSFIPDSLIGGIEVITGGASATYGSDAVSGVVNFKLRRDLRGFQLDAKASIPETGDGGARDITASWGSRFADDRGLIMLSAGFHDRDKVMTIGRDFFSQVNGNFIPPTAFYANDAGNSFNFGALAGEFASYGTPLTTPTQIGVSSQLLGLNENGTLYSIFNLGAFGSPYGFANYRGSLDPSVAFDRGGLLNVNYSNSTTLQAQMRRYNAFGRLEYELTDGITAYAQFNWGKTNARSVLAPVFTGQTFGVFVPFATPEQKARVQAQAPGLYNLMITRPNPNAAFSIYKGFTDNSIGRREQRVEYRNRQILAGLKGKFGGDTDITWDLYGASSRVRTITENDGASLSAIQSLLLNPGQCSGYNVFSGAAQPQDCIDFIKRTAINRQIVTQDVIEGTIQGSLVDLPAGKLRFAVGADYRRNHYGFDPDDIFLRTQTTSPAGPRNPPTSDFVGDLGSNPASGTDKVREVYGELFVPVITNTPLIQELNIGLGARYSDYNSVGGVFTYKADVDWRVGAGFRIRSGYNRAVRAPSVGELYRAQNGGFTNIGSPSTGQGDPCSLGGPYRTGANATQVRALCIATGMPGSVVDTYNYNYPVAVSLSLSNPDLKEETADTYSVGLVWSSPVTSPLFRKLSASIDYYNIKIDDAIGTVPGNISLAKCFNAGGSNPTYSPTNFYCQLILRDAGTGVPVQISIPTLNLATYQTSGIDMQLDWEIGLDDLGLGANAGALRLNLLGNYLESFKIQALPDQPTVDYAGTIGDRQIDPFGISKPRWKATVTAQYAKGPFDLSVRWRYIGSMRDSSRATGGGTAPGVKSVNYTDLNIGWQIARQYRFGLGVDNLFDRGIPLWQGYGTTDTATYDMLGRRFYATVRANF